ncbi:hypothetical protein IWQ60_002257 [Tieghemiomyces parasiticus]|uniref:Uncharacterized protein n=1 Tax=Tieghemiomyces parasiticus TaxID=78921 RepID=A0A9W8AJC8_9FUNG|nr:hypothetical protein IWQ60_002257 [Tieghemiomyces parasiticus]
MSLSFSSFGLFNVNRGFLLVYHKHPEITIGVEPCEHLNCLRGLKTDVPVFYNLQAPFDDDNRADYNRFPAVITPAELVDIRASLDAGSMDLQELICKRWTVTMRFLQSLAQESRVDDLAFQTSLALHAAIGDLQPNNNTVSASEILLHMLSFPVPTSQVPATLLENKKQCSGLALLINTTMCFGMFLSACKKDLNHRPPLRKLLSPYFAGHLETAVKFLEVLIQWITKVTVTVVPDNLTTRVTWHVNAIEGLKFLDSTLTTARPHVLAVKGGLERLEEMPVIHHVPLGPYVDRLDAIHFQLIDLLVHVRRFRRHVRRP